MIDMTACRNHPFNCAWDPDVDPVSRKVDCPCSDFDLDDDCIFPSVWSIAHEATHGKTGEYDVAKSDDDGWTIPADHKIDGTIEQVFVYARERSKRAYGPMKAVLTFARMDLTREEELATATLAIVHDCKVIID